MHNIHTSYNTASANCLTEKGKENTYLQKKKPLLVSCEFHFLVFLKCCGAGEKTYIITVTIHLGVHHRKLEESCLNVRELTSSWILKQNLNWPGPNTSSRSDINKRKQKYSLWYVWLINKMYKVTCIFQETKTMGTISSNCSWGETCYSFRGLRDISLVATSWSY